MHEKLTKTQQRDARRALTEAIERIGGPTKVGALCGGISSQAVSQWEIVPEHWALVVSRESGVSATKLRPDIYPEGTVLPAAA